MSRQRRRSDTNIWAKTSYTHWHRQRLKAYQHFLFLQRDVCGLLRYEKLMVIVHVISGDSPVVHITWINSRVRIMVLNLQARQFTCSNHTHCKESPTHEQFMVEKWFASISTHAVSRCWSTVQHRWLPHVLQLEGPSGTIWTLSILPCWHTAKACANACQFAIIRSSRWHPKQRHKCCWLSITASQPSR